MMTESAMPWKDPSWWAIGLTALAGFIGWRVKGAADGVRLANAVEEIGALKARVASLEHAHAATTASLAAISTQLEGIGRTLDRIERRIDGKADK